MRTRKPWSSWQEPKWEFYWCCIYWRLAAVASSSFYFLGLFLRNGRLPEFRWGWSPIWSSVGLIGRRNEFQIVGLTLFVNMEFRIRVMFLLGSLSKFWYLRGRCVLIDNFSFVSLYNLWTLIVYHRPER